jgi:hypothetical protein
LVIDDNPITKIWIKIILNPCCFPKHIYHLLKGYGQVSWTQIGSIALLIYVLRVWIEPYTYD